MHCFPTLFLIPSDKIQYYLYVLHNIDKKKSPQIIFNIVAYKAQGARQVVGSAMLALVLSLFSYVDGGILTIFNGRNSVTLFSTMVWSNSSPGANMSSRLSTRNPCHSYSRTMALRASMALALPAIAVTTKLPGLSIDSHTSKAVQQVTRTDQ